MKRSPMTLVVAGIISCGLMLPAVAQTYNGQQLQGHVTYVPTGTNLDAALTTSIDSSVARPGDSFGAKLYAPLYVGNDLVFPANTMLEGQIVSADKSGLAGKSGIINLRLVAAVTPDGQRYPLSALVQTTGQPQQKGVHEDKQGNLKGATTKKQVATGVARTAAWTAGGTLLGICFAPIVAGSIGAGAIAGVATGGAVGLGSNLWRKGHDVKVPSGTRIVFSTDQPMQMSPAGYQTSQNYQQQGGYAAPAAQPYQQQSGNTGLATAPNYQPH